MDLQALVMTTFVLLEAEWPLTKGRKLIEMLKPTHVIVHRSDLPQSYYLYTSQGTLDSLQQAASASSIHSALNLQETDATPLLELSTNAENAPDRCIIRESG